MYLFTEYVFGESVDSAHNSQISSTFQEADCLLKLVKINKQVFAITLLSRNFNHAAQLSISARGGNNKFVSGAGRKQRKRPNIFSCSISILEGWCNRKVKLGLFRFFPPVEAVAATSSVHVFIHWIRLWRVSRQCTQITNLKYLPRSWLLADAETNRYLQ